MRNITILIFFLISLSIHCFAQCDGSDSFSIDNFISDLKSIEKNKKEKLNNEKDEIIKIPTSDTFIIENTPNKHIEFNTNISKTWEIGFSEGLAKVTVGDKSGYINRQGQIVIKPLFEISGCFCEGLAAVKIKEKWGFIDQTGNLVIPAKYDAVASFTEGLALVKVGKFWGYINRRGEFEIEPKYERAESFSEGLAAIGFYDKNYVWTTHERPNGKWVDNFIDKSGQIKFSKNFDGIYERFNGGMALVGRNIGYKNGVISESYFIDKLGRELWKLNSSFLTWFSDDLIIVAVNRDEKTKRDKYSFLDRNGNRITNKEFDSLSSFSEGLAVASIKGKDGFINKMGNLLLNRNSLVPEVSQKGWHQFG